MYVYRYIHVHACGMYMSVCDNVRFSLVLSLCRMIRRLRALRKGFLFRYAHVHTCKRWEGCCCFSQVVRYALNRLQSLNEFCVICDEKHVLETGLIKVNLCGVYVSVVNVHVHAFSVKRQIDV